MHPPRRRTTRCVCVPHIASLSSEIRPARARPGVGVPVVFGRFHRGAGLGDARHSADITKNTVSALTAFIADASLCCTCWACEGFGSCDCQSSTAEPTSCIMRRTKRRSCEAACRLAMLPPEQLSAPASGQADENMAAEKVPLALPLWRGEQLR